MYSLNARDHFNCSPLLFSWPAPQNRCGQTEGGIGGKEAVMTTGAIRCAKLQTNHHHQQTNTRRPSCCQTNSVKAQNDDRNEVYKLAKLSVSFTWNYNDIPQSTHHRQQQSNLNMVESPRWSTPVNPSTISLSQNGSVVKSRWLRYFLESRSICLKSKSSFKIFYFLESRK